MEHRSLYIVAGVLQLLASSVNTRTQHSLLDSPSHISSPTGLSQNGHSAVTQQTSDSNGLSMKSIVGQLPYLYHGDIGLLCSCQLLLKTSIMIALIMVVASRAPWLTQPSIAVSGKRTQYSNHRIPTDVTRCNFRMACHTWMIDLTTAVHERRMPSPS